MKFIEIDSLEMISNSFNTESKSILEILNVDTISRVGWRSYFIYEFYNKESQEKYLKNFTNFKNGTLDTKQESQKLEIILQHLTMKILKHKVANKEFLILGIHP
ncbi:hypothetical protein COU00_00555 [Candidatus Falkowbacteria bacterium CG10_big_fil_rev_8_21_14_0_10_43_11]|uniref:Uncharacterized protein n=1 Tax=Candidatus Falkowbacteria bacterium CG10_big_fil_rev_8_21_14_0_10_43_11 TaxID=1974568 RepID=A0A2M6WN38_9BACT|nr:MAG: hypothetical protein COU00_00555 [Candidatus Falkowbacteria bacterium CG10_big_fil_rev_8_21_14_0_10_43_11]